MGVTSSAEIGKHSLQDALGVGNRNILVKCRDLVTMYDNVAPDLVSQGNPP